MIREYKKQSYTGFFLYILYKHEKKLRRSYKLWSGCDMIEQSHKKEVYATIDAIGHNMP